MAEMAEIDASGLTFSGLARGEGIPALLLHGFPDTPYSLATQVDTLSAAGYRICPVASRVSAHRRRGALRPGSPSRRRNRTPGGNGGNL